MITTSIAPRLHYLPRKLQVSRVAGGLAAALLLATSAVGCTPPPSEAASICPESTVPEARVPWQVGVLLPDASGPERLDQARELALALVCDLRPGDTIIVINESTFTVVVSEVVPGDAGQLAGAEKCAEVPVGGPSPECLEVALAIEALDAWRRDAVAAIASVSAAATTSASECATASGWPRDQVVQLLLSLQPQPGSDSYAWLIVGGDADALGDGEPLGSPVASVHVVAAPYSLSCGSPQNLEDWFQAALAIDLYPAESPPAFFTAFLRAHTTSRSSFLGGGR